MVEVAVLVSAEFVAESLGARLRLVPLGMELTFMPTVRFGTIQTLRARILVNTDCLGSVPHGTWLLRVTVELRLASEVLPVMRVNTAIPLVR